MSSPPRFRPLYAVSTLILLLMAACTALPPVFPGASGDQPGSTLQPAASPAARLEGTVTYRPRIALSPDAVVEVSLQDVSRADAPATVLARQTIEANGKQVPIPYALEYDASAIDPRMTYSVSARITEGGKLTWISTSMHPVLTRDAPDNNVEIVVEQVNPS